uniref:Reverse transcriptase domain-containing protein n=1 Tax=Tanacetum cinerariifolium TaxID=118510 RepID=A0A6L2L0V0_TANCI|nr:reverse transcriptase domain-containing protein [Tanacetum cinerariifolium]
MTTLAEHIIVVGAENRPPMLEKSILDLRDTPNSLKYNNFKMTVMFKQLISFFTIFHPMCMHLLTIDDVPSPSARSIGICHTKPYTLRGGSSTKLGQSPSFVEANYETLESLLRDRRRQMRNNDIRTELEYFSEDYDEEREMEPRPRPARAVTPPLRAASPKVCRRRERVVGFKETQNKEESRVERNSKGRRPSEEAPRGNGSQNPMYTFPNMPAYANPNLNGLFPNPLGSVTPFVRWIEDYPLPYGLKMPFHIGSYDEKGDPDNFMHLFEGAIRMQKWTRSLVERLSTDLPLTYKGLMEKTYTWVEEKEVATNGISSKKDKSIAPVEAPILMINREDCPTKNTVSESMTYKKEITYPPVTRVSNAPVIIEATVFERKVGRVYMDSGSTCEVIYKHCFEKLNPTIKATRVNMPLVGFLRKRSWSVREVPLEITIEEHPLSKIKTLNFVIVKFDSPHNILLGRTSMQKIGILVSTIHGAIKIHTKKGVGTVLSVGEAGEETKQDKKTLTIKQIVTIGKQLPEHFKKELRNLLRANADIFAWTNTDMTGISRTITIDEKPFKTEHKLNEYSHIKPIKQNKRSLGPDCNAAACKEAEELTKAGILRKVKHQTWVANPVMVKKNDGGWRMCVDFTDINKACPKDCYPLPEINWKIESLAEFSLKCFLDAYKGYHQIQMAKGDEDKTAFFVGEGVFCYGKMPFGLKNAGATYQRLVDKVFSKQIGRNLEAYVDDMVIKSTFEEEYETDKAFKEIKKFIPALPTLTTPRAGETLIMYLAASKESINAMLFAKRRAGLMLIDLAGKEYTYAIRFEFETTKNEVEYKALLRNSCQSKATCKSKDHTKGIRREAAKIIQDCDKCKEKSVIRKAGMDGAIIQSEVRGLSAIGGSIS